jgi:hypothetical protein
MATTATITLASDVMAGFGGITNTMTLTEAGTLTDLKETTGYSRKKLASASKVDLFTMADTNTTLGVDSATGAKIFIKNIGYNGVITKDVGIKVFIASVEIGVLYGGDWLVMPLATTDAEDVEVQPADDNAVVLEWAMFYQ